MPYFTVYKNSTGEIVRVGFAGVDDIPKQAGAGETVLLAEADDRTECVVGGTIVPRPPMPVVIDKTTVAEDEIATITGIPVGSTVYVDLVPYEVNDGEMEVSFTTAGTYWVRIACFPWIEWEVYITCA